MVHWDREKTKKILLIQIIALLFGLLTFVIISGDSMEPPAKGQLLEIESSYRLPLRELSGLHVRQLNGETQIYGVGDKKAKIVVFNLENKTVRKINFESSLRQKFTLCSSAKSRNCAKVLKRLYSDWEALRVDESGYVYLLQEHSESLVILNPEMDEVLSVVNFDLLSAFPKSLEKSSKKFQSNSLGEGLVLLNNGHFLVAKEMNPISLVEFGPADQRASGINSETFLNKGDFKRPNSLRESYKALHYWDLAGNSKCDFSDIAYAKGQLYVLSQKCQQIFVFDRLNTSHKSMTQVDTFSLPRAIKNPEALAILKDGRMIVGSDVRSKKKNLFVLKNPLDGKKVNDLQSH